MNTHSLPNSAMNRGSEQDKESSPTQKESLLPTRRFFLQTMKSFFKKRVENKKAMKINVILLTCAIILLYQFIALIKPHPGSDQTPLPKQQAKATLTLQSDSTHSTLVDIQTKLAILEQGLSKRTTATDLAPLTAQLNAIQQSLAAIRQGGDHGFAQQWAENNAQLESKISTLQADINTLAQSMQHTKITYLKADALPFSVLAIDMIQQQGVVTVRYDYKTFPIQNRDRIAGWQLIAIDYTQQTAEFINAEKQQVLIHLHT